MPDTELKAGSRRLMYENAPRLFLISALYILMVSVLSWLSTRLPGTVDVENMYTRIAAGEMPSITMIYRDFRPAGVFLALVISLLQPVLDLGFMSFCLKTRRGSEMEYKDIFDGFRFALKCLAIFIVTSLLTLLWSILLIIPGIVASYRYRLSFYVLLDDPSKGVMQCIDESVAMMRGSKLDLFILDISFLGWVVLDFLFLMLSPLPYTPPLVMIWLAPYRGLTYAGFYEQRRNSLTV